MFALVPEILNGQTYNATVVGLSPWVEYEFRVVAGNNIGIGEPSKPSELLRTKASGKKKVNVDCRHGLSFWPKFLKKAFYGSFRTARTNLVLMS